MKNIHITGLNFIRFIAAFAILFYHFTLNFHDKLPVFLKHFCQNLTVGVDLFFLLSGFLIVYLLLVEKEETTTVSLLKFYIRRLLRIFPLYFLIVFIAYLMLQPFDQPVNFLAYFFFIGNFWMIHVDRWTTAPLNPLWSISIEEHFYLIIPTIISVLKRKWLPWFLFFIIIISISFRLYAFRTYPLYWMRIYCHTLSRIDILSLGGIIAYLYHNYNNLCNYFKRNELIIFSFFMVVCCMLFLEFSDYSSVFKVMFKKYIYLIPLSILFIGFIVNQQSIFLKTLKKNKLANYLGKISFGIYMYHSPVLLFFDLKLSNYLHRIPELILATITTCIIAALSYEFFEKRILNLKEKFIVIQTQNA